MIKLLSMPFASLTHIPPAPGLLKAILHQNGLEARVYNFNMLFARLIGFASYETIAFFRGVETQVGEWLFNHVIWETPVAIDDERFLSICDRELGNIPGVTDRKAWLRQVKYEVVPLFLDKSMELLDLDDNCRAVGFSCSFFQTLPSLALGKKIRETHPHVKLVYGGPCFHDEMGKEFIRAIPWIDVVGLGEADETIAPLFRKLLNDEEPTDLPGMWYRDASGKVVTGPEPEPTSTEALNDLPVPDFTDFFKDAQLVGLRPDRSWQRRLLVPFESSRGCWWGEKVHCRFCGLNGNSMVYREKAPEVVYDTLQTLSATYNVPIFQASDNNLAMDYFDTLLRNLADKPLGIQIYYNVKPNMTREMIAKLSRAGIIYLQPGIESLSPGLLRLLRKGVSVLQNIFFLKCCREYNLVPYWNNLIRIPGETAEDYSTMEALLPLLRHLRPPYGGANRVELHRFSPYFCEQEQWIDAVKPQKWYYGLYPEGSIDIPSIAYYFEGEWKDVLPESHYTDTIEQTHEWVRIWREEETLPSLRIQEDAGNTTVIDDRNGQHRQRVLTDTEAAVYRGLADPISFSSLMHQDTSLSVKALEDILACFIEEGLAIKANTHYLGLALSEDCQDPPLEVRKTRFRELS